MRLRLTGHQLCQPKDALSSGRLGKLFAWYSEAICVEHGRVEYRGNCSEGCALTPLKSPEYFNSGNSRMAKFETK